MQVKITVNTQEFQIPQEKLSEILNWLAQNSVRTQSSHQKIQEVMDIQYPGQSLIEG